jgi:hypothetical protein
VTFITVELPHQFHSSWRQIRMPTVLTKGIELLKTSPLSLISSEFSIDKHVFVFGVRTRSGPSNTILVIYTQELNVSLYVEISECDNHFR